MRVTLEQLRREAERVKRESHTYSKKRLREVLDVFAGNIALIVTAIGRGENFNERWSDVTVRLCHQIAEVPKRHGDASEPDPEVLQHLLDRIARRIRLGSDDEGMPISEGDGLDTLATLCDLLDLPYPLSAEPAKKG